MKTKRRGFFAVIGGGFAAFMGFKPVEGFCICKTVFIPPCNPMNLSDLKKARQFLDDNDEHHRQLHWTRLQKAMAEESKRMQEQVLEILEERHKARMGMLGFDNEN